LNDLLRTVAAVLLAVLACAGCNISVTPSDAGAGTDAAPQTVRDQCNAIYSELCMQAIGRCPTGAPLDMCITNGVDMCCTLSKGSTGSACDQASKSPASAVDACKTAIDGETCYAISINNVPPQCQGVPQ
jgi:hypothetical protein